MIDKEKFEFIKKKYGHRSSWAIWKEVGETPKSNMGDLNVLDPPTKSQSPITIETRCGFCRFEYINRYY